MRFDHPVVADTPHLRQLWTEAFGDGEAALDNFFHTAFSPERCLCAWDGDTLAAAAYWFSCGQYAYIYAVATAKSHRGRGICHSLMEKIHTLLARQGFQGAVLVPGESSLRQFYGKMGYENFGGIREFTCSGSPSQLHLDPLDAGEFAARRRNCLPQGGVVQEGENLAYLSRFARFYAGEDFLLAATEADGTLCVLELLGNTHAAPGIVTALGAKQATFRTPGDAPFAMYKPLHEGLVPTYFGFAFD